MTQLIVPLVVLAVAVAIMQWLAARKGKKGGDSPGRGHSHLYDRVECLMSAAERSFFGVLEQAVPADIRLFAKVRLADLVSPKRGQDRSSYQAAFNRIQSKHVDFVACDAKTLAIKFVVELDDRSHEREDRKDRDELVDTILGSVGIPVYRFPAKRSYALVEIRERLAS